MTQPTFSSSAHLVAHMTALLSLERQSAKLERWGALIGARLLRGGRLLACGNGGSASQAQHLTAELVGRFREERPPLSALALHADGSALTAIANDYAYESSFERQVMAHGRHGDILICLSTSGSSRNVLAAARVGRPMSILVLALTGAAPNPLVNASDEAVVVAHHDPAIVQEIHLVAIHLLCAAVDVAVRSRGSDAEAAV